LIDDGKSHIKGSTKQDVEELEVEKIECAESASEACPAQCIHIEK
jgi:ferredoxin